jgi:hypothetical protein
MTAVLGPADDNAFLRDHAAARQAREERITRLLAVVMAR